ncbi:bacterial transcriptional regulator family protein [Paraburkholderia xenovorans LB400]|uniref:Transcriptional regulator, IclR family n=1 Tax=Paraburkholderia xenovorans (strain LB400) TaxID=266265 RepID=Q13I28_PARXL|nr:IclR family transcriptional regulator [Paraburkholderia xenovorans]ABE36261.1 transcriptional regulator, IclR family [Paraburkholderia xenovorans LB400]AIP34695.1 bacterial transcriptional regulator family protein [Paraburkholderia xenovorans LB400]
MAKSALRVLEIMEFVATHKAGCATHTEISQALGIPKSSLTALLTDLQRPGYLELDRETGRYAIGSQVMFLAHAYLRNLNIVRLGTPVVHDVFLKLNVYTTMVIPKGDMCLVVCSESLPSPLAHSLSIGQHIPMLHSALGRAILAFLEPEEVERFLHDYTPTPYTDRTKTGIEEVRKALAQVRKAGFAHMQGEYLPGIIGIAVPVFNLENRPIAAIGIGIPAVEGTTEFEKRICKQLLHSADTLSRRLGAKLKPTPSKLLRKGEEE